MRRFHCFASSLVVVSLVAPVIATAQSLVPGRFHRQRAATSSLGKPYLNLPLRFEGQKDGSFLSRGLAYSMQLTKDGAQFQAGEKQTAFSMRFVNATPSAPQGEAQLAARTHYLVGDDPKAWRRDVLNFGKVRYANAWPGVDAVFYGSQQRLEYDLELQPGADPR